MSIYKRDYYCHECGSFFYRWQVRRVDKGVNLFVCKKCCDKFADRIAGFLNILTDRLAADAAGFENPANRRVREMIDCIIGRK